MANAPLSSPLARRRLGRLFLMGGVVLLLVAGSIAGQARSTAGTVRPAAAVGGPGGTASSSGITNLSVNLTDAPAFEPNALTAPAAGVLAFRLANPGSFDHTFTITNLSGYVFPPTISPAALTAWFHANGSLLNVSVPAGQTVFANVSVPSSDAGASFEIVSLVAYQFQAGMFGFLNLSGGASGPGVQVTESTTDTLRFVPDQLVVNATSFPITVDVQVTNTGGTPHTFTLEGQSNNTLLSGNYSQYFTSHPPLADVSLNGAGVVAWANFTVIAPGVFEYICKVPGHFANGMLGWLYVGVAPPTPVAGPSTALVDTGVLVGAGALLGIGALFTVAGSYTGRFRRPPSAPPAP